MDEGRERSRPFLFPSLDGVEAAGVKLEQVIGVVVRGLGAAGTLESRARPRRLAIRSSHGDELHQVEGDVFVAARADGNARYFIHECVLPSASNRRLYVAA